MPVNLNAHWCKKKQKKKTIVLKILKSENLYNNVTMWAQIWAYSNPTYNDRFIQPKIRFLYIPIYLFVQIR